jgi:multidrug resistance protein MdtO
MICVGVPLWDRQVSAETNVEDTLWLCLACAIGVLVTVGVETLFFTDQTRGGHRRGRRGPSCLRRELVSVFRERLPRRPINASNCSAPGHGRNIHVAAHLTTVCHPPNYAEQMGAVIALTGRLVDLAGNLTSPDQMSAEGRQQIRLLD